MKDTYLLQDIIKFLYKACSFTVNFKDYFKALEMNLLS